MSGSRAAGGGTRVLLVGEVAEGLAARLALSGYQPLEAAATGEAPQAVVLAPDSEGKLAALRRAWGAVPILLGLRGDSLEERVRCLASGADDFWLPERPPSDLLTRLRLHLGLAERQRSAGRPPAAPAAAAPAAPPPSVGLAPVAELRLGDLRLDPLRRLARRGDHALPFFFFSCSPRARARAPSLVFPPFPSLLPIPGSLPCPRRRRHPVSACCRW